ncbi:MAG: DUF4062 domain-containing protein [Acidocella sp.]|uniref:DUF4062 domain-containing protein n=1 Tax=Acidocella sp. TaxID=50710 RepID=UPI003FC2F175
MSQSVRYQVFISSTFTDLKEERAEVIQAIWELDCIPTGMEAFVATNETQWEVIKKVIDECDYYVLIIGGRYGTVTAEGMSYTEKEYNYAKSLSLPVLGFVHGEPENIPAAKTERDESGRTRLEAFRKRVMEEHPIRKWTTPEELGGIVSRSITRQLRTNPRPGWIRNVGQSNLELLEQINALTQENMKLKNKMRAETGFAVNVDDLESGSDEIVLEGFAAIHEKSKGRTYSKEVAWSAPASWDDIFRDVGPILMREATEVAIQGKLARFIAWSEDIDEENYVITQRSIAPESFDQVIVQLRALGLVDKGTRKRAVSDRGSYWALTDKGEHYLVGLLARRKGSAPKSLPDDEPLAVESGA